MTNPNYTTPQSATQTQTNTQVLPNHNGMKSVFRRVIPTEFQPPRDAPRRILAAVGYFRMRTWVGAHGDPVADAELYQPLYSPWLGEPSFERVYQQAKQLSETMAGSVVSLRRENGDVIFNTLFPLGTAKIEGHTISETGVQLAELSLGANLPGSGTEFSLIAVNSVVDIAVLVRTFSDQFSINPLDPNSPNFSVTNPDEFIGLFFWTRH